MVSNDTIIGLGTAYPDNINLTQGILLVQLDSNFNILRKKLIIDSLGRDLFLYSYSKNISRTKDGGYIFTAATVDEGNGILYKLDQDLNVKQRFEFVNPQLISNFAYRAIEVPQGYLLYALIQKQTFQIISTVRRIDYGGNIIWEKEYLFSGDNNIISDLELVNDSIGVVGHTIGKTNTNGFSGLRLIDLATGNSLQYTDTSPEPKTQFAHHFVQTDDGGYITYSRELVSPTPTNGTFRPAFTKYNANLEKQWRKNWGKARSGDAFHLFETYKDQNGHLISIGKTLRDTFIYDTFIHQNIPYDYHVGWVFKFTENGDSIWSREIPLTVPHSLNNVSKSLYGGGVLSSGNIIAGGSVQIGPNYYSWLIKLTSDGCIDSLFSCSPWTPPSSATEPFSGRNADLSAYPNPAYRWVNLQFSAREEWGKLTVFNGTGQIMLERSEWLGNGEIPVSVSTFPPGLYHAVVELPQGQRWVTRIAVVR